MKTKQNANSTVNKVYRITLSFYHLIVTFHHELINYSHHFIHKQKFRGRRETVFKLRIKQHIRTIPFEKRERDRNRKFNLYEDNSFSYVFS